MGELIRLAERRATRLPQAQRRPHVGIPVFHFDLACPFSYLAAERVDRLLPEARWRPTSARALGAAGPWERGQRGRAARAAAERRAATLRLPLVWPQRSPAGGAAMRAAAHATELGRGAAFGLAAGRLAFCGGFRLDDPEVLAEAAAAAGLGLEACLRAAGDAGGDVAVEAGARPLLVAGADRLPVIRVGRVLHVGERRIGEAAASLHAAGARA